MQGLPQCQPHQGDEDDKMDTDHDTRDPSLDSSPPDLIQTWNGQPQMVSERISPPPVGFLNSNFRQSIYLANIVNPTSPLCYPAFKPRLREPPTILLN
jgi:hypothetical protein